MTKGALAAVLGFSMGAACAVTEIDLDGKACPCTTGFFCDERIDQCVRVPPPPDDPPCEDGIQGGSEVDIDCGGECLACPGATCTADSDCVTASCNLTAGRCALASGPPRWTPVASLDNARFGLGATLGGDGRIYAVGGFNTGNLGVVEAYTPLPTDRWDPAPSLPVPRRGLATATGSDGTIYAMGGKDGASNPAFDVAETYLPGAASWQTISPLSTGRFAPGAARGPDGRIYVVGGQSEVSPALVSSERYDPASQLWSPSEPLSVARYNLAVIAGPDSRLYALGGLGATITATDAVESFSPPDFAAGWVARAPLPTARFGLGAAVGGDDRIYAIGGVTGDPSSGISSAVVEAYSPAVNGWDDAASLPVAPGYVAASAGANGCIYALGGIAGAVEGSANLADVYQYCPQLSLSPISARADETILVTGENFAAGAKVHLFLGAIGLVASGVTDDNGALPLDFAFTVPRVPAGSYTLTAVDTRSRYPISVTLSVTQ